MATMAFFLLLAILAVQILFVVKNEKAPDPLSQYALLIVLVLLTATTIARSISIDFIAITSTCEALVLFAELVIIVLVLYRFKYGNKALPFIMTGGTLIAIILLALSSSPLIASDAQAPVPALRSNWLIMHILFAFFGEAFFTVSFLASLYYLVSNDEAKKASADALTYKTILIGYLLFTTGGLIFGAIWAYNAWGRYWGWDPKETSAFVTWLVYTEYLHIRLIKKTRGKVTAIFSIVGFMFTVFTFIGANFLLKGLHSY